MADDGDAGTFGAREGDPALPVEPAPKPGKRERKAAKRGIETLVLVITFVH